MLLTKQNKTKNSSSIKRIAKKINIYFSRLKKIKCLIQNTEYTMEEDV